MPIYMAVGGVIGYVMHRYSEEQAVKVYDMKLRYMERARAQQQAE